MIPKALASSTSPPYVYAVTRPGRFSSHSLIRMALHTRNSLQLGPKTIEEEGEGLHQPEARMVAISQKADSAGAVEGDGKAKDESTPKNMAESACSSKPDKQPDKSKEDSKDAELKTFRTQDARGHGCISWPSGGCGGEGEALYAPMAGHHKCRTNSEEEGGHD